MRCVLFCCSTHGHRASLELHFQWTPDSANKITHPLLNRVIFRCKRVNKQIKIRHVCRSSEFMNDTVFRELSWAFAHPQ